MTHEYWPNPEKNYEPEVHPSAFVAPSAYVAGRVTLKENSSIWPGSVLRADINEVVIGRFSNIQDLSICHVENDRGCIVGDYVTVGHQVLLHSCTIEDEVLVGMGSIIMNGARVGKGTMIGAGSLVTENKELEPGALYLGRPAKKLRNLTEEEMAQNKYWAGKYAALAQAHREGKFKQFKEN